MNVLCMCWIHKETGDVENFSQKQAFRPKRISAALENVEWKKEAKKNTIYLSLPRFDAEIGVVPFSSRFDKDWAISKPTHKHTHHTWKTCR